MSDLSFLEKCDLLRDMLDHAEKTWGYQDGVLQVLREFVDDIEEGKVYD